MIQYLKLRGTWGRVGNSNISGRRFAYLATVKDNKDTSYQFGKNMDQTYGTTAIDEYAVDVTWEIADKANIGLDMRLLNNKFNLQFDAFKESRKEHLPAPHEHPVLFRHDQRSLRQHRQGREQGASNCRSATPIRGTTGR